MKNTGLNNSVFFLDWLVVNLYYIINTLKLVNPLNILSNGYSLVKLNDKVIKSSKDLKLDDKLNIKLHDGEIIAKVEEIK